MFLYLKGKRRNNKRKTGKGETDNEKSRRER
jgi:hypothetical protein